MNFTGSLTIAHLHHDISKYNYLLWKGGIENNRLNAALPPHLMNYLIFRFLLFSFELLVFGRHSSVFIFSCRLRDVIQSTWPIPRGREEVVGWTSRSDRQCVCVCARFSLLSHSTFPTEFIPTLRRRLNKTSQTNVRRKNFSSKLKPRVSGPFLFLLLLLFSIFLVGTFAWESWNDWEDPVLHKTPLVLFYVMTLKIMHTHWRPLFLGNACGFLLFQRRVATSDTREPNLPVPRDSYRERQRNWLD